MKKKFLDVMLSADSIVIYSDGKEFNIKEYSFKKEFLALSEGAYYMPGMAVAEDKVIKRERLSGIWLDFRFKNKVEFAELSFDTLTLRVRPNLDGFNVIRGNEGDFSGKTYYLQLATYSDDFYEYISSYIK